MLHILLEKKIHQEHLRCIKYVLLLLWHFDVMIFTKWKCFLLSLNFIDFICYTLMYKTCFIHIRNHLIDWGKKYLFLLLVCLIWWSFLIIRPYLLHFNRFFTFHNFLKLTWNDFFCFCYNIQITLRVNNICKAFLCNAPHPSIY